MTAQLIINKMLVIKILFQLKKMQKVLILLSIKPSYAAIMFKISCVNMEINVNMLMGCMNWNKKQILINFIKLENALYTMKKDIAHMEQGVILYTNFKQ